MSKKNLTTQEILAAARAQAGSAEPSSAAQPADSPKKAAAKPDAAATPPATPDETPAATPEKPAAKVPAAGAGGGPKSTKDILAAARAQAAQSAGEREAEAPAKKAPVTPKPAAAGGMPKSTKDILAAARAAAGGGQAEPAASSAAKPGKAATRAAAVAALSTGDRPSVQEMIRAVREGTPAGASQTAGTPVAEKGKLELPPRPQRPAPATKPVSEAARAATTRRNVLITIAAAIAAPFSSAFAAAWTLFTASTAAFGLAAARFMMPNVLVEPPSKFKVGPLSDYPPETVSDKWKSQYGTWIVHTVYNGRDMVYALASICTHLGCTPNWLEGERKFKCPCHGSGFYINGVNFEGPAPRPLERYAIRVAEDGMIEVDKSAKFQQEMGQWDDPTSFVKVG